MAKKPLSGKRWFYAAGARAASHGKPMWLGQDRQQLHERIGASRAHLGTVLRILLSGGHVTHQGYPRSYIFNHVRAFKDRANDPFDIAQEQAT